MQNVQQASAFSFSSAALPVMLHSITKRGCKTKRLGLPFITHGAVALNTMTGRTCLTCLNKKRKSSEIAVGVIVPVVVVTVAITVAIIAVIAIAAAVVNAIVITVAVIAIPIAIAVVNAAYIFNQKKILISLNNKYSVFKTIKYTSKN